jgi:hypothetical protein
MTFGKTLLTPSTFVSLPGVLTLIARFSKKKINEKNKKKFLLLLRGKNSTKKTQPLSIETCTQNRSFFFFFIVVVAFHPFLSVNLYWQV